MVGDAGAAAEQHAVADHATARDAGVRRQQAIASEHDVVADLYEVIDLGVLADGRVTVRAAVDAARRADADVILDDDPTQLGNVHGPGAAARDAEAGFADDRVGQNAHAVADQREPDHRARADEHSRPIARPARSPRFAPTWVPEPISTPGPTTTPGPSSTSSSSRASG
jgi:hypothetical protein